MKKEEKKIVKGYKAFDKDLKCRGFQYELGKDFTIDGKLDMCNHGFHFCRNLADVYSYYSFGSVVAEVEAFGEVVDEEDGNKSVTNGIRLIRILDAEKETRANIGRDNSGYLNTGNRNTGNRNTGHLNTGDWNTGDWNTGYWNTGYLNTGDRNTGNWNTGDMNTGFFNTATPEDILVFNKPCKRSDWDKAYKPQFFWIEILEWREFSQMTDEEKEEHQEAKTTGGYLKEYSYQEAWARAWDQASEEDKKAVEDLPNFDWKIFSEITGIKQPKND